VASQKAFLLTPFLIATHVHYETALSAHAAGGILFLPGLPGTLKMYGQHETRRPALQPGQVRRIVRTGILPLAGP
jgi:hypothetical protein